MSTINALLDRECDKNNSSDAETELSTNNSTKENTNELNKGK